MLWDDESKPAKDVPVLPGGIMRPSPVPPALTLAEAEMAKRFGWDLRVLRGQQAADIYGGSGAFRLTGPVALLRQQHPKLDVLRVVSFAQFGNLVRQLRNVFAVARKYGARHIEFPSPHPFFAGTRACKVDIGWQFTPTERNAPEATGLVGRFYYLDALRLKPPPEEQAEVLTHCVRSLLAPSLKESHPDVRDDDLAMHFRGGDIFGTRGSYIHLEYGQPPVSYYLAAIEREKPSRVWLVHQDRGNPAVNAIESILRAKGVEVISQSGTLDTDLRVLFSASRLVAGIGSFVPSVAALSARAKRLYLYGGNIPTLQRLGVTVIEWRDMLGNYDRAVRSRNWTASAEQRALMLSYPFEALGFTEHAATG